MKNRVLISSFQIAQAVAIVTQHLRVVKSLVGQESTSNSEESSTASQDLAVSTPPLKTFHSMLFSRLLLP
jgi:hypothetical protein